MCHGLPLFLNKLPFAFVGGWWCLFDLIRLSFVLSNFQRWPNCLLTWSIKWQITPLTTFILVLLALSPCLYKAWKDPRPRRITRWVAYAYMCGFLFGWHVHEKASLHFVIPLAIVAVQSMDDARHYFMLSIGIYYGSPHYYFSAIWV